MPLITSPKRTYKITLEIDKDVTPQPAFIYRYLTCEEYRQIGEVQDTLDQCKNTAEVMDKIFQAASMNLVGWENMTDANGNSLLFAIDKLESIVTMPEMQELIVKQLKSQNITPDEKKSSELQPELNLEQSAVNAKG